MKRRREMVEMVEMEKGSELRSAIEELSVMVKVVKPEIETETISDEKHHSAAFIPTIPFLSFCNLIIQVLDKIGPTMAVLRQDMHQNIERLEKLYECDPKIYSNLVEMVKKELEEGNAKKGHSCSKALVWLIRSMDFTSALLQRLGKNEGTSMEQIVEESYTITLKPWHGWISSAAFKVALKLVPDSKTFLNLLKAKDENNETLEQEMQTFLSLLDPFLQDLHSILRFHGLDKLKST